MTIPPAWTMMAEGPHGVGPLAPTKNLIYLEHWDVSGNSQLFLFPVNPETVDIAHRRDTQDGTLLRLGNFSRPGVRQPIEVTFASFFPSPANFSADVPWINMPVASLPDPWDSRTKLREWQNSDDVTVTDAPTPLRLTITDSGGFSLWVMITDFSASTKPREVGDVYYSISFREAARLPDLKVGRITKRSKTSQRHTTRKIPPFIAARKRETFAILAHRVYEETSTAIVRKLWAVQTATFKKNMGNEISALIPPNATVKLLPHAELH